ncbi:MAG: pseudouridine synthase [Proteobacteria bacterium]|nr:pseudouridine synthase [Pseudomonadota bacterium]
MLVAFNKPYRVLSQFTDEHGRETLADYIDIKKIYAIGRLDFDSEGLLLLTDDGKLKNNLASPQKKVNKVYLVQVEGIAKKPILDKLKHGVRLKDGKAQAVSIKLVLQQPEFIWSRKPPIRQRQNIPTSWVEITINTGRNRQVRRMLAHIGLPVLRLIRTQIGPYKLDNLINGQYTQISLQRNA